MANQDNQIKHFERYKGNEIIIAGTDAEPIVGINGMDIGIQALANDSPLYTSRFTYNIYSSPLELAREMIDIEFILKGKGINFIKAILKRRVNVAKLSAEEMTKFRNALFIMKENGEYDKYVFIHKYSGNLAHYGPAFLPWNRIFCYKFEQELQNIDPDVVLPYWDSTTNNLDSHDNSKVWRREFLGKSGEVTLSWTGRNGSSQSWQIRRNKFNMIAIPVDGNSFNLNRDSYPEFRPVIENRVHSAAHVFLGVPSGDQCSFATAVNDPYYFLIQGNIDRLWVEWQLRMKRKWIEENPGMKYPASQMAMDYYWSGTDEEHTWTIPPNRHNLDDILWPWDGTHIPNAGSESAIPPWSNGMPENFTPRMMLNHHDWGYAYDTEPRSKEADDC
jgi:hypothetical protein